MIRVVIAAVFAANLALPAAAADRRFDVVGFDRILSTNAADVEVHSGSAASVRAVGDAAALDRLDIRVEGRTLRIASRGTGWDWHGRPVSVFVAVPAIAAIESSGSGDIRIDRAAGPSFAATLQGSGDLRIDTLDTRNAAFRITGSGDILAAGRCATTTVDVSGSGDVDLRGLRCETLTVHVAGSGDVTGFATRAATIAVQGSGDVTVTGGAKCTTAKAGSGDVRCS